jgi:hypothetical protein
MGKGFLRFIKTERYDYKKAFQELIIIHRSYRTRRSIDEAYTDAMVRQEIEHILRRTKKKWWHL